MQVDIELLMPKKQVKGTTAVLVLRRITSETDKERALLAKHRESVEHHKRGAKGGFSYGMLKLQHGKYGEYVALPRRPTKRKETCVLISERTLRYLTALQFRRRGRNFHRKLSPLAFLPDAKAHEFGCFAGQLPGKRESVFFSSKDQSRLLVLTFPTQELAIGFFLCMAAPRVDRDHSKQTCNIPSLRRVEKSCNKIFTESEVLHVCVESTDQAWESLSKYTDFLL
jgi:hypothetical protein